MQESTIVRRPWLHGPASDLLLGCGGLFSIVFVAFAWAGPEFFAALPFVVPALLLTLVGMPHYGATLVRVYDHRADRRSYALFSVAATLLILGLFIASLQQPVLASALFTIYLTWSPWHYAGQNYGITTMFVRRRGVPLPPIGQRALHLSFRLSFLLVFVLLHLETPASASSLRDVHLIPIGIPITWGTPVFAAVLLLYLVCLLVFLTSALRVANVRELTPSFAIVLTQILWHSLPIAITGFGVETSLVPLDPEQRTAFFTWIAAGHSLQYMWITSYYARSASDWHGTLRYYAKVLAAGTAIWTLPTVLLAPSRLGMPSLSGYFLLLAAVVNIHHFVLDGAIWKLRNARISRVLIRSDVADASASARGHVRKLVWALAGGGALAAGLLFWHEHVALPSALSGEQPHGVVRALDLLARFERDDAALRLWAARRIEQAGEQDLAMVQYQRSLALDADVPVLTDLVRIHVTRGDAPRELADACRRLYALLPDSERVPAAVAAAPATFRDPQSVAACYRSAGLWRTKRAHEIGAESASAEARRSRDDASLALGY